MSQSDFIDLIIEGFGPAKDKPHVIELLSFAFDYQRVSGDESEESRRGIAPFCFTVTRYPDQLSPALMQLAVRGISTRDKDYSGFNGHVKFRKATGDKTKAYHTYLQYSFKELHIESFGFSSNGSDSVETLSFCFRAVALRYEKQADTGVVSKFKNFAGMDYATLADWTPTK